MIGVRFAFRGIGFISTLILARLLKPDDFGLVGLASAVFSLLDTLTDMSVGTALIRMATLDRRQMDTAWTLNIGRGAVIGASLALSAGLAADWMRDPRVTPILWVLATTSVIQGFENIGMVAFRRDLRFGKIFEYQVYGKLVAVCVTLSLAWVFRSYWALVAGTVMSRLFGVAFSYAAHPYRPRLSLAAFGELFHFSKWLMINNLLSAIEAYTARLLFGRIGGAPAVGLYEVSWQIGSLPTGEIAAPIREPIYAGYARLLGNPAALRRQFNDTLALMTMVICPMSVGLAVTSELTCRLLLGPKWDAASELIRLCAMYALFDSIGHFTHNIFVVLNRQRRLVLTYAPTVVLRFGVAIWAGVTWGMVGAVWVLTLTALLNAVMWMLLVLPLLALPLGEVVDKLWRTALSSTVMAGALVAWLPLTVGTLSVAEVGTRMAVAVTTGAAICIGTQLLLWLLSGLPDGPEARIWRNVAAQLGRLASCRAARRRAETR